MNNNISDKDKKDWENFISKKEKLPNKDLKIKNNTPLKVKSIDFLSENLKGELTVVISEQIKGKKIKKEIDESVKIEIKKMIKKYSHKDVVDFISKKENLPKKEVYNFCLKIKK